MSGCAPLATAFMGSLARLPGADPERPRQDPAKSNDRLVRADLDMNAKIGETSGGPRPLRDAPCRCRRQRVRTGRSRRNRSVPCRSPCRRRRPAQDRRLRSPAAVFDHRASTSPPPTSPIWTSAGTPGRGTTTWSAFFGTSIGSERLVMSMPTVIGRKARVPRPLLCRWHRSGARPGRAGGDNRTLLDGSPGSRTPLSLRSR